MDRIDDIRVRQTREIVAAIEIVRYLYTVGNQGIKVLSRDVCSSVIGEVGVGQAEVAQNREQLDAGIGLSVPHFLL